MTWDAEVYTCNTEGTRSRTLQVEANNRHNARELARTAGAALLNVEPRLVGVMDIDLTTVKVGKGKASQWNRG